MGRCRTNPDKKNHLNDVYQPLPVLSTYRTVFVHSLERPVFLALNTNIEPVTPAVEIFSHLSDGFSVGVGDLANVGKLHPDNQFLNNRKSLMLR